MAFGPSFRLSSEICSVAGLSSKRFSLHLVEARFRQGPFAPPELPGFTATTTPSDSRGSPTRVMDSPPRLTDDTPVSSTTITGLSGSQMNLSTPATPNHPGGVGRCNCSCLHDRWWLHRLRKAGPPHRVTRPNRVHLRCGWCLCVPRLRTTDYSAARSVSYTEHEHLPWLVPFN